MKNILAISLILSAFLLISPMPVLADSFSLSQTNISLNVGQSTNITANQPGGQTLNITSVTNSYVAYANVSGNQITIYGLGSGSTQITFCTYTNSCATVFVTVSGNNNNNSNNSNQISFSQNNLNLNVNQTSSVSVFNSGGSSVYISNNSNPNAATVSLSGNTINITGINSGSSTITVCATNSSCNYLYVTISGNNNNSGQISFSQNNVSLNVNQTSSVTVFNSGGSSVYISNNSNPNIVGASISGNNINLAGINTGSATITVCATNSSCNYLYATVNGSSNSGQIGFSQNNVTMNSSEFVNVTVYNSGNNSLYISSNSNSNAVSATLSGNLIALRGQNSGFSNIAVCANNSACANLSVTVSGNGSQNNLYFAVTSLPQPRVNQYYSYQLIVNGGTPSYNFSISSGFLPSGLFLAGNGQIYGTPTGTAGANFAVRATDNYGNSAISQTYFLTPTSGSIAGSLTYNNGTLVNDNGTIYITYKNTKSGFGNYYSFTGLGYRLENAISGTTNGLNFSGFVVSTPAVGHPWGSWIKAGSTVYFVHETGLIPIPNYDIFLSNGGITSLVVAANSYDFNKSIQPLMTYNDFRLK